MSFGNIRNPVQKKNRDNNKSYSLNYREAHGCLICRTKENLTFHHVDSSTKRFNIGSSTIKSPDVFKREIDKCVVLCYVCHQRVDGFKGGYL